MHPLRTFIVEDSPVIRENLVATLEELVPVQVVGFAEDEAGAVRWLREPSNEVQLGIIDIVLKQGSGLGVLKALHGSGRALKLVVLSNYVTPDIRRRCLDLGADQVFDKSGDIDALIGYCEDLAAARADGH
jgi:DNA-binding NarL/FixJ family response regulator